MNKFFFGLLMIACESMCAQYIESNYELTSQGDADTVCPKICGKKKWTQQWNQAPLNPDDAMSLGSCECK